MSSIRCRKGPILAPIEKVEDEEATKVTGLSTNPKDKGSDSDAEPASKGLCGCFGKRRKKLTKEQLRLKALQRMRRASTAEQLLCDLGSDSEILTTPDIINLSKNLPPRAIGFTWLLTFSTTHQGFSLRHLYKRMENVDSPTLILIRDLKDRVFGALVSCALKVCKYCYGSSSSFLFRFHPEFQVFRFTGENFYFVSGCLDCLCFGLGDGKFGIYIDQDLNIGRTDECSTYGSPPLVEEKDFIVKTIECWTFGH